MPGDGAPARAERQAHGKFSAPCVGACQEEIGDVDAADQQQEKHTALQQIEGGLDWLSPLRLQGVDANQVAGAIIEIADPRLCAVVVLLLPGRHL